MVRKIVKYLLRLIAGFAVALAILVVAAYLPPVQRIALRQAEKFVARKFGMELSIERLRLRFPLRLSIDRIALRGSSAQVDTVDTLSDRSLGGPSGGPSGDTLLRCGRFFLAAEPLPLLRGRVAVSECAVGQLAVRFGDLASGLFLRGEVDRIALGNLRVDPAAQELRIGDVSVGPGTLCAVLGGAEQAAKPDSAATSPWRIAVGRFAAAELGIGVRFVPRQTTVSVALDAAGIERAEVDPARGEVAVERFSIGCHRVAYRRETADLSLNLNQVRNRNEAGVAAGKAGGGRRFDPDNLLVTGLAIEVDSIRLQVGAAASKSSETAGVSEGILSSGPSGGVSSGGSDMRLAMRVVGVRGVEQSGIEIDTLCGRMLFTPDTLLFAAWRLATPGSHLRLEARAAASILALDPDAPLDLQLDADLAPREWAPLLPALYHPAWRSVRLSAAAVAAGRLGAIDPVRLQAEAPGLLRLTAAGTAHGLPELRRTAAEIRFDGAIRESPLFEALLSDTVWRRRLSLPSRLAIDGTATLKEEVYGLRAVVTAGAGQLDCNASLQPAAQRYSAAVRAAQFPLGDFLPHDSVGPLDMTLQLRGAGFDPLAARTAAQGEAEIGQLPYRGHDFGGIALRGALARGRVDGRLVDRDSSLRVDLAINGLLSAQRQQVAVCGGVGRFDLAELGIAAQSIGGSFDIDVAVLRTAEDSLALRVAFDSIRLYGPAGASAIRPTAFEAASAPSGSRIAARSGDFALAFESPAPFDRIAAQWAQSVDTLRRTVGRYGIDMARWQPMFPSFRIVAAAGSDNILNNFLRTKQLSFTRLQFNAANRSGEPLAAKLRIDGIEAAKVAIDTLQAVVRQSGEALEASLRVADRPAAGGKAASEAVGSVGVRMAGRTAQFEIQRSAPGADSLRLAAEVVWNTDQVRMHLLPRLGSWLVNPDNYIVYAFAAGSSVESGSGGRNERVEGSAMRAGEADGGDEVVAESADSAVLEVGGGRLSANLEIARARQRLALRTIQAPELPGALRLDIAGLDIARTLAILPAAPPVGGQLATAITLGIGPDTLGLLAAIAVDSLVYDRQPLGNIALHADYARGHGHRGSIRFALDEAEIIAAQGHYNVGEPRPLDVVGTIDALPLNRLNTLLPKQVAQLAGTLDARLHLAGEIDDPVFDGAIAFSGARIDVPMIGTAFRLAADTIRMAGNSIDFGRFALLAPNNSPLNLAGSIGFAQLDRPTADLRLTARNFQFLDVPRRGQSIVYGVGFLDLDASARGPLDQLVVRGSLALRRGTDINYVMQESADPIEQPAQNVVTFVSFDELDAADGTSKNGSDLRKSAQTIRIGGLDLMLDLAIGDDVGLGVDLSPDGQNRVDLRGGGNLAFAINPLGDISLAGKYLLAGGTVSYNPPVIARKTFAIRPGSYVEWTGNIADPSFDITAVESLRASVTGDDNQSRSVNFEISVNLRNTLENLAVSFDLAAPQDLTMQNQLQSMSPQQRAMQAMNLLIYNTYTGPGTTARVAAENPLNAFVQRELNQWAQNSLRGVDLSFGIDSYGATDPNGARTDYSYRLSKKLFGNRVQISIGGKFSTAADPSENLRENMIDDIALEYLLNQSGTVFVRLFRHTGYESILEGEITETGVGFIVRKKMSRLGDLFRAANSERRKRSKSKSQPQSESQSPSTHESLADPQSASSDETPEIP